MNPSRWATLVLLPLLAACAHRQLNVPLASWAPDAGHRLRAEPPGDGNGNELFVVLTFSGGGIRAAALAYGVLEELRETPIRRPCGGAEVRLLDEVDLISSVSGGSFTSAYYGLFRDRIFDDFPERCLNRNLEGDLAAGLANPLNWTRLMSSRFDRIDMAAEVYDEQIFERSTFADLRRHGDRPHIVINAVNMTSGNRFPFTQDRFDILGSDLDPYPVANAVAASSAVPVAFSPMTLKNHPAPAGFDLPRWIRDGEAGPERRLRRLARGLAPYHREKDRHPFVHLLDGGIVDNTGLRVVIHEFERGVIHRLLGSAPSDVGAREPGIKSLLVIVVNAKTRPGNELDMDATSPGFIDATLRSIEAGIGGTTVDTVQHMEDMLAARRREEAASGRPPKARLYLAEVAFENIADPERRAWFESLPTSLSLDREQVSALIEAGRELLSENGEFLRFLREHGASAP